MQPYLEFMVRASSTSCAITGSRVSLSTHFVPRAHPRTLYMRTYTLTPACALRLSTSRSCHLRERPHVCQAAVAAPAAGKPRAYRLSSPVRRRRTKSGATHHPAIIISAVADSRASAMALNVRNPSMSHRACVSQRTGAKEPCGCGFVHGMLLRCVVKADTNWSANCRERHSGACPVSVPAAEHNHACHAR